MFIYFSSRFDILCDRMPTLVHVSTLVGDPLVVDQVYRSCVITLVNCNTLVDMIILNMVNFDFISGMD